MNNNGADETADTGQSGQGKSPPQSLKSVIEQLAAQSPSGQLTSKEKRARTISRFAAVQALYQMELTGTGVDAVVREFRDYRFDGDLDGDQMASADEVFFEAIVRGVVGDQARIDLAITDRLASNWRLERIDATVRAILRAGAFELIHRNDIPKEIAIDEYVELAKAFFDENEARFVNGALDGVAKDQAGRAG